MDDPIGFLFVAIAYFGVTAGPVAAAVWHVDRQAAVPGASPWRMRFPKLAVVGGPVLYALAVTIAAAGVPRGSGMALLLAGLGSFVAPWVSAVLITVEWFRRRAEDRTADITQPVEP